MRVICITLSDRGYGKVAPHRDRAAAHFTERGLDVEWYLGLDGPRMGLQTRFNMPGRKDPLHPITVGTFVSHRALWAALLLLPDEDFLVLEDDAKFPENWRERFDAVRANLPADWDVLFAGSCCTDDKRPRHVAGDIWEVRWPMAMHCYLVRRRALVTMCEALDAAGLRASIDIATVEHVWPRLRVYTVLPRIADQYDTELLP